MKICPICDKRIVSNWCGNCFKFVTPWEISDGIYINERHSQHANLNCDYHNPQIKYSQQEYMAPGYEEKIYGNQSAVSQSVVKQRQIQRKASTTTNRAVTNRNTAANKPKKGNIGTKIAIAYVIFILLCSLVPAIFEVISEYEKEPEYSIDIDYPIDEYDDFWEEESEKDLIVGDAEEYAEEYSYLAAIEPVEVEEDDGYIYKYFEGSDLKLVGHNCDDSHMNMYYQDLTTVLDMVYPEYEFEYMLDDSYYYNYLEQTEYYDYASFYTYVDMIHDNFAIQTSYDSSTEQLHYYLFYADDFNEGFMQEVYKWLEFATPELFDTYDEFANCAKEVAAGKEPAYFEYEDIVVYIAAYDEYVMVDFESNYY